MVRCIYFSIDQFLIDMREQYVFDPLVSKRSQLYLATQLVKMVLKIDDVVTAGQQQQQ